MTVNELDLKLDELARQFARRERAQRLIGAGATSVAMTFGLGVILYLLEGHPVPLAIPFALYLTLLGATWFRYRRKTAMISRQRIALFLDERHPELENLFVTGATAETQRGRLPAWVLDRILEAARAEAKRASVPELFSSRDDARLTRHGLAVAILGVALCLAAVYLAVLGRWDLDRLHSALILGLVPDPIPFTVEPGDARLRVGDDQVVWLRTADTESTKSVTWREAGGSWRDDVFLPSRSADVFYFPMNNVQADIDYVVRVGPGASDTYRLSVYNPPFVVSVELTCLYPAYLDLAPKALAYDRRQSVPEGSDLQVTLRVNKPLASAALVFASGSDPLPLARLADTRWTGRWTVAATDSFRIDLADVDGEHNEDWWHVVTTISDQPPTVRIREPRGDGEATRIEEVPFSFAVKDDYGLKDFGLQYEVSGRDPVRVSLKGGGQQPSRASVEYILTLEDLDLEPGDYLVWSVWAEDARPDRERFESLGDPYFLEIRPFARTFSEAVSNEGGFQQGEGGRGDDPAQQQKRIIIATWNLRRKSRSLSTEAFQTQRDRLVEAQQKLAAQSLSLTGPRELTRAFLEAASAAAAALAEAAPDDPSPGLAAALTEEQRAYRLLLQLRPDTAQVARRRGEGSPRGGGDQQGLDALELSERRDFEERATTLGRQLADTEEIRDRIDDLARRQDAINRDIDDLVARVGEEEEKEQQRRLERLQQEQRRALSDLDALQSDVVSRELDPQTAQTTRSRLGEARQQMEAGLESLERGELQQARSTGSRARQTLGQIDEQLQQLSRLAVGERIGQLQDSMQALSAAQDTIQSRVAKQVGRLSDLPEAEAEAQDILELKRKLADQFARFMNEAGELAERSAASQELLSNRLGDWLRRTSRAGIYEDIENGERYVRYGAWDVSANIERSVGERLALAADSLAVIGADVVRDDVDGMRRALSVLQDLAQDLENDGEDETGLGSDWDDRLRSAQALLPAAGQLRRQVVDIRGALEALGRRYRASNQLPHRDIVVDAVLGPLSEVIEQLQQHIVRREGGSRLLDIPDSKSVPDRYRDLVAEYFRKLAQTGH